MLEYEITWPFRPTILMPVPNSSIRSAWAGPEPVDQIDMPAFNAREFHYHGRSHERTRKHPDGKTEVVTLIEYEEEPITLRGHHADALRAIGNRNGQPIPAYIDAEYQIQQYDQRAKDIQELVAEALKA